MTQAEKTLLRYQYVMANTSKVQGDFARTANTWHNQIVILKQQFLQLATVIGSALIQALKPFVMRMNSALSGLIKFAQNVVNALGKIFGWEMEVNTKGLQLDDEDLDYDADALEGVADAADDVADANNNAAKATKKLNDQLQGFDKLNVLRTTEKTPSTNTSKKNNKGKGDNGTNGNGLVSGGDVDSILKKTKSKFKSDIDSLEELGKYIGDALKKALDGIKWDDIYKKASNFGKGLANFLNGLISPELFYKLGETVAKSINTVFHFLNSFGKVFKWDNFGKSMAFGLNGFMRNLDWGLYMDTAKTWAQGIADTLNNFVKYTNWQTLGSTIAKAIKTAVLFFLTLGTGIGWKDIGKALARAINGAIKDFPAKELANTIDAWVQGIFDLLVAAVTNIHWNELRDKIAEFISNLDFKTIAITLGALTLLAGASFAVTFGGQVLANIAGRFVVQFSDALSAAMTGSGSLINAISTGLTTAFAALTTPVGAVAAVLAGLAAGLAYVYATNEKVREGFKKAVGTIKDALQPALDFLRTTVLPDLKNGFKKLADILSPLGDFLKTVFTSIWVDFIIPALEKFGKDVLPPLVDAFKTLWTQILVPWANFLADRLKPLIETLSTVLTWLWQNVLVPLGQFVGGAFLIHLQGMAEGLKLGITIIGGLMDAFGSFGIALDNIKQGIGTFVSGVQTSLTQFWESICKFGEDIVSVFSGAWESLKTGASEGVQTLSAKWDELNISAGSLGTSLAEKWEDMKTKFAGLKDSIVKHAGTIVTQGGQKFTEFKNAVSERVGKLKSDAEKKFDELKTSLPQKISDLASKFKSPLEAIAKAFENGFKNAGTKAINQVTKMYNDIVKKINDMIEEVKKILPMALGNLFDFKLPKFKFETETLSLANLSITYPSNVRVSWHKKAYQNPMMFTQPTLMPSMNGLKGFGDGNGGEIVYGHKNLMNDIREASGNSDMTAIGNRQLANDQRIISLLQVIAEKEFGITGDSVFRTVRDQASRYEKRTGKPAFDF